jgi:hypothetical protein
MPTLDEIVAKKEFIDSLPKDQKQAALLAAAAVQARDLPFSPEGFGFFFLCGTHHKLPPYAKNDWVPALYQAYLDHTGVLLEGFRGATKSTIIFWWVLYVQGKRPVGSTNLVRINDSAAAETGNAMAEIIENSMTWKSIFPNVVPDKSRSWSTEGWNVKDISMDYSKWIEMCIADHIGEPSILTAGITSGNHIGKHPSNGWYFDDFHDEENTRSVREMQNIVDTIEKNIIPTWNRPEGHPTLAGACTLWNDKDGYHALLRTGLFKHIKTPIFTLDPDSDIVYPGITNKGAHIRLAWPEAFPVDKIVEIERENPVWFPVMYLCDLNALKGTILKKEWLHEYPAEKIGDSWPVYFGIDFASTDDKLPNNKRDYFVLAVGKAVPGGGIVLVDGLRGKFPSSDSMGHIQAFAVKYPSLDTIGLEKWGKGETFKDFLIYNTHLPIVPCPFQGQPVKSKGQRYEAEGGLAPLFVKGDLWISSDLPETEFGQAFEDEWIGWDGSASKTGNDDCLDGVYWMAYIAQGHLMGGNSPAGGRRKRQTNPYNELSKVR